MWVLYATAGLFVALGVVLVVIDGTVTALASLAPLIGVLVAVAAGIQALDRYRLESAQVRAQADQETLRRFDQRFAAATQAAIKPDAELRAAAAVDLFSFLRDENREFHMQTYYFVLSHQKLSIPDAVVDQAFVRVFERAAHLVLPNVGAGESGLAVDFSTARLPGADLTGLELAQADLTDAVLRRANLSGACLWRARGMRTDLTGAVLRHANLEEVVLLDGLEAAGADFSFANLVAARFAPRGRQGLAVLRDCWFVGARLQGADFSGADLRDARFDGANLKGTTFHGAQVNEATRRGVLCAVNHTWRRARWDDSTWRDLKELERKIGGSAGTTRRKESDVTAPHYRRHPFPGHPNHTSRPRWWGDVDPS